MEGHFWLEQNSAKASKWAKLARQGHDILRRAAELTYLYFPKMTRARFS
jgi:hypothetical protein